MLFSVVETVAIVRPRGQRGRSRQRIDGCPPGGCCRGDVVRDGAENGRSPLALLCLRPNHHAQLDYRGLLIDADLVVWDRHTGEKLGSLRLHPRHPLDEGALAYRRGLHVD